MGGAARADARTVVVVAPLAWIVIGVLCARWREARFRITPEKCAAPRASGTLIDVVAGGLMPAVAQAGGAGCSKHAG